MVNKAIAYVRNSDKNRGSVATQKDAIESYCRESDLIITEYVEEHISASKTKIQDRELQKVINNMEDGTAIVMSDITRLGRSGVFELLGAIGQITSRGELHLAYTQQVVNQDNQDKAETIFTVVGGSYAAVDEAKKRSQRAKAAHQRRRSAGLHIGRRVGQVVKSKLDEHSMRIAETIKAGGNKTMLAKELGCSRMQLHRWIEKNMAS